jgi:hypothetical protein
MLESEIKRRILVALNSTPGVWAINAPTGVFISPATGAHVKVGVAGMADILVLLRGGRVAWCEVKTEKGRQRDDQKVFEAECAKLGIPYIVCRSPEEAREWVRKIL